MEESDVNSTNEMKDNTSIFASGIALDDIKSNDKSHDDDDDDDYDYDELNPLKQLQKDKEKNNIDDDQNDRNALHSNTDNDDAQENI